MESASLVACSSIFATAGGGVGLASDAGSCVAASSSPADASAVKVRLTIGGTPQDTRAYAGSEIIVHADADRPRPQRGHLVRAPQIGVDEMRHFGVLIQHVGRKQRGLQRFAIVDREPQVDERVVADAA